jgi:hypothetical protein
MPVWPPRDERDDLHTSLPDQVAGRIVPIVENHFLGLALRIKGVENRFIARLEGLEERIARLERVVEGWQPFDAEPLKRELVQAITDSEAAVHDHLEEVQDHLDQLETGLDGLRERGQGIVTQLDELADELSALAIRVGGQKNLFSALLVAHLDRVRREIVTDLLPALAGAPAPGPLPEQPDLPPEPGPDEEIPPGTVEVLEVLTPETARQAGKQAWSHENPMQHLENLAPGSVRGGLNGKHRSLWLAYVEGACKHLPGQGPAEVDQAIRRLAPAFKQLRAHFQQPHVRDRQSELAPIANALVGRLIGILAGRLPSTDVLSELHHMAGPRDSADTWCLEEAHRQHVERWIARAVMTITLKQRDWPSDRAGLWLRYLEQVRFARPVVPRTQANPARAMLRGIGSDPGLFEWGKSQAALILRFPTVCVVTFQSDATMAYLYRESDFRDREAFSPTASRFSAQKIDHGTEAPQKWTETETPSLCHIYQPTGLDRDNRIWVSRRDWVMGAQEKLSRFGLHPDSR